MASKEYLLAKYLNPGDDISESVERKKKKKKRPKQVAGATVGIVDEDADDAWKASREDNAARDDLEDLLGDNVLTKVEEESEDEDEGPKFKRFDEAGWQTVQPGLGGADSDGEGELRGRGRRHDTDDEDDGGRQRSPPRRRRHDSDSDGDGARRSPEPKRRHDSRSPSPPGTKRRRRHDSRSPSPAGAGDSGPRMADGSAAGLQKAADLRREAEKRRTEEMKRLSALSSHESGRNAATVYREKSGRKVDMATRRAEELAEQRRKEAEEEAKMAWGKGLAQEREKEESALAYAREAAKPLARYADDREMNEDLMDRDRWGDPMAGLVKKRKKTLRPLYKGPPPPPNRFGILPGYRWDGVQRDNGFEKKLFEMRNEQASKAEAAYAWSTEDM
ncbi:Pre-mRNA-splicing factor of RES complex-domain-containing protein [Hyaloraphidium curvatum]|nr:Pre-mRNA-splicing factor of RES complex-domain-containing protein [Hyaloraphidium curvatum]